MRQGRWWRGALASLLLAALVAASPASAYTTPSGYQARDFATGFRSIARTRIGPLGIAFDTSDNLYVSDVANGTIYRFQPGGGKASSATQLNSRPIVGAPAGLAITPDGRLYAARQGSGDVVEIDTASGQVVRTVASGIRCATGLAVDPVSGDLFVSQSFCGNTVWRISGFANGPGTKTPYTTGVADADGLAFDTDGTLYAESANRVLSIGGTSSSAPGVPTDIAHVSKADGLAFGAHAPGEPLPFLVANRNDGKVTRVAFGAPSSPSQRDIFSGGSRGDFAAVDSTGALYITQSDRIVRLSGDAFEPTTPSPRGSTPPQPGVGIDSIATAGQHVRGRACKRLRRISFRLRQSGRVRLRSATVYLNHKRVKRLGARSITAPIVLTRLPTRTFSVKVIARTTKGRKLTARRVYRNC